MVIKVDLKIVNTLVLNSSFEKCKVSTKKMYLIIRFIQFNLRI